MKDNSNSFKLKKKTSSTPSTPIDEARLRVNFNFISSSTTFLKETNKFTLYLVLSPICKNNANDCHSCAFLHSLQRTSLTCWWRTSRRRQTTGGECQTASCPCLELVNIRGRWQSSCCGPAFITVHSEFRNFHLKWSSWKFRNSECMVMSSGFVVSVMSRRKHSATVSEVLADLNITRYRTLLTKPRNKCSIVI